MKKCFVFVVLVIIFSAANFADAAHYWIGSSQYEEIFTNTYIDTDELGIVYLENNKLYFSKDKNIVNSKGVLFKVGCISVDENLSNKKQWTRKFTLYFYRGINYILTPTLFGGASSSFISYSVFNDFAVENIIDKLTYNCVETEGYDPSYPRFGEGLNCLSFKDSDNEYVSFFVENDDEIYNKARELFGVQNNYKSDKIQQLLDINKNVQKIPSLGWSQSDFDDFANKIDFSYDKNGFTNVYDFGITDPLIGVKAYFRWSDYSKKIFQSPCVQISLSFIKKSVTENDLIIKLFPGDAKIIFADESKIFGKSDWLAKVYPDCSGNFVYWVSNRENGHPEVVTMFGYIRQK